MVEPCMNHSPEGYWIQPNSTLHPLENRGAPRRDPGSIKVPSSLSEIAKHARGILDLLERRRIVPDLDAVVDVHVDVSVQRGLVRMVADERPYLSLTL